MEIKNLILIGAGGHCKSCIEIIETENKYTIKGILDREEKLGQEILGYPVIGTDDEIENLVRKGFSFLITIGQIKTPKVRKSLFDKLKFLDAKIATVISPYARVSRHAIIGEGVILMHNVTVNAGAVIGENCILNTGCTIEHDAKIGMHCHVSTGAVINGDCIIGAENFIGSNSVLVNNIQINPSVVIGAGSLVTRSISESGTFVGSPVKKI